jgi:RNA polymerase sigma factor (sigma-70 family)
METEQTAHIQALVHASQAGDSEASRALYEHLIDKVFAYVRYRTSSEDTAIDLTQDVFIDLYRALANFTYSSLQEFYGFVFTITKRKLAKHYAHVHTQREKQTTVFDEERFTTTAPEVGLESDIARALETLDEVAREIVVLHHWSRYSFGEIAALIEMTESAVRVRHHRALKLLSATIEPQ